MERATPEDRKGLFPWGTGQGSRCSSPKRSVRFMSIFCTGCKNLERIKTVLLLGKPFKNLFFQLGGETQPHTRRNPSYELFPFTYICLPPKICSKECFDNEQQGQRKRKE